MAGITGLVDSHCARRLLATVDVSFILIFLVILALLVGGDLWKPVSVASLSSFNFDTLSHESNKADI